VKQFAGVLDDHLSGRTFLLNDHLTVADFAVSVTLPHAAKIRLPLDGFSNIARWQSLLEQLPGWRNPFPQARAQAA
jgi:glutathione S-transferase